MPQISRVLRSYECKVTGRTGYGWWCPGCNHMHYVPTDGGAHPVWSFDGNLEAPTFSPSYKTFIPKQDAYGDWPARPERTICHCFVKVGQIEFLSDSAHQLRGFHSMVDLGTILDYRWGYD